jgi:hypothetical protein
MNRSHDPVPYSVGISASTQVVLSSSQYQLSPSGRGAGGCQSWFSSRDQDGNGCGFVFHTFRHGRSP